MPTPQLPGFGDIGAFIRWKKSIDYRINLLFEKLNNVLANTGLSVPSAGVTQVDGTFNVLGTENVSGNLNVTGSATIGGPTTISGLTTVSGTSGIESSNYVPGTSGWKFDGTSLEANTGVIGNGALANPTSPQAIYDSVQNFSLSTTLTNIRTTSVTVPSGFTKAAIQLTVRAYATNPNTTGGNNGTGGDYLYAQANVNGFNGYALPTGVSGSNGSGTNVSTFALVLTGLTPGGTISLQCAVQTGFLSWAANASNTVDLSASIGWYR